MRRLPKAPPYTVYLGNLSYECSEDDIFYFFERRNLKVCLPSSVYTHTHTGRPSTCMCFYCLVDLMARGDETVFSGDLWLLLQVKEVRLPTDSGTSRLKGFGYAELESVSALLEALELSGEVVS